MSMSSNTGNFAVWVGGQLKGLRSYVDQQVANATSTLTTTIGAAVTQAKVEVKADLLGGATAAYDTLQEIKAIVDADAAADQASFGSVLAGLAKRLRVDAAQTFTTAEQTQARANIGAASAADLGPTDVDYVALAVAARDS